MASMDKLVGWFGGRGSVMVALSGGVDSALVALAAHRGMGDSALAVTADYRTLSGEELASARRICKEIGIKHAITHYDELEDERFARNDNNRCFHCRTRLGRRLLDMARARGIRCIVDGTNLDDLGEYRPGIRAMRDGGVYSPLVEAGFTKDDVRREARRAGLSIHDRPSNSCLASRIPWGQRITAERLARIELGEAFIRDTAGIRQVRVRDMDGSASIEVPPGDIWRVSEGSVLARIDEQLRLIGFDSVRVDAGGYRPGKINVIAD